MRVIPENTVLVQTSELRTRLDEVLKLAKGNRVLIERHHKPVAVLVDLEQYERLDRALEELSDVLLALEARARERRPRHGAYVPLAEVEARFVR